MKQIVAPQARRRLVALPAQQGPPRRAWLDQLDEAIEYDLQMLAVTLTGQGASPTDIEWFARAHRDWLAARVESVVDAYLAELSWAAS